MSTHSRCCRLRLFQTVPVRPLLMSFSTSPLISFSFSAALFTLTVHRNVRSYLIVMVFYLMPSENSCNNIKFEKWRWVVCKTDHVCLPLFAAVARKTDILSRVTGVLQTDPAVAASLNRASDGWLADPVLLLPLKLCFSLSRAGPHLPHWLALSGQTYQETVWRWTTQDLG